MEDYLETIKRLLWFILAALLLIAGFLGMGYDRGGFVAFLGYLCLIAALGILLSFALAGIIAWLDKLHGISKQELAKSKSQAQAKQSARQSIGGIELEPGEGE